MKNYYLVRRNGEATIIGHDELNSYPFVCDVNAHEEEEKYSPDWQLYETTGTEWCVAYAETAEEAAALVHSSADGLKNVENVWCEICGHHHEVLKDSGSV